MAKKSRSKSKYKVPTRRNVEPSNSRSYLGSLELLVMLAIDRLDKDAYGAGISKAIIDTAGISAHIGAVYTSLIRLENKKLIRSAMGKAMPKRGGKAKRFYILTERGRTLLDRSVNGIKKLAA